MKKEIGLALGGLVLGAALTAPKEANAAFAAETTATPDRTIACGKSDAWYSLKQGEVVKLRTRGAVAIADISSDGVFQSDNDGNTATELVFKSDDKDKKSWNLSINYPGSVLVAACNVTGARLDQLAGRWSRKTDVINDAIKRVNLNVLVK